MNIKLKGKYLYYLKYKIKCSIGKEGITKNKKSDTHQAIFVIDKKLAKIAFKEEKRHHIKLSSFASFF